MKTKRTVLLFEDSKIERPDILAALTKALPRDVELIAFTGQGSSTTGTYETRILNDFGEEIKRAELIVCDQDLSLIGNYTGLSAQVITGIAHAEGIPIALYGRGPEDYMTKQLKERRSFVERRFLLHLDSIGWDPANFAQDVRVVYDGSQQILRFLEKSLAGKGKKPVEGTPAKWMSQILGKPSIVNRLDLYGSGDQQYLGSLTASNPVEHHRESIRVLAAELGYWLWESILRFPGITVNSVAAASMLNLSPETWQRPEVQKIFLPAKYDGPFGVTKPFWWRDELRALVEDAHVADGLELIAKNKIKKGARSRCCVDPSKSAGYYCMLAKAAVSLENSLGDIPYFPSGADLARISSRQYARVAPWAGMQIKT